MATEKTISARMQMKTDTALNWSKAINFIPKKGEIIIYEADSDYGYERMKIGDGSTKVNDLPFVIGAKDWNQNDSTASDYIKNRPGGYTVNYPALNIEWDGVIGDRVSVDVEGMKFVKVSDEIPKVERLVGGILGFMQGDTSQTTSITDDMVNDFGNGIYGGDNFLVVNKAPANFVNPNTGAVVAVFQETGVYFTYMDDGDVVVYVSSLVLPAMSRIVPIPQEYVEGLEETTANANQALETLTKDGNPGDILVKTETGSAWQKQEPATSTPDWNQNDETAADYVKNRPGAYKTISPEFTVFASGTFENVCELQEKKILDGQEFVVETVGSTTTYVASELSNGMVYFCSLGRLPEDGDSNYFLCAYYLGIVQLFASGNYIGQEFTIKTREISVISLDPVYLPDDAQKKVFVTADDSGITDMSNELIISYAKRGYMVYLRATTFNGSVILPLTSISSDGCFFSGYIYLNATYMLYGVNVMNNKSILVTNTMSSFDIDSRQGINMIGSDRKKYNINVDSGNIIATEVT